MEIYLPVAEMSVSWIAMIAPLFLCDIDRWIDPNRRERVKLGHAASMGLMAFIFSMMFHGSPHIAIAEPQLMRIRIGDVQRVPPDLARKWLRTFL